MKIELQLIGVVAAALVVALLVALVPTPVIKNLAFRVGAVDVPKDGRRMHDHPIPRMGGLAIFLGFLLSVLLTELQINHLEYLFLHIIYLLLASRRTLLHSIKYFFLILS